MDYDKWIANKIQAIRNKEKYKHLKSYIKNIKDYEGNELQSRVINNMLLASRCHDIEYHTNTNELLHVYLRRNGYEQ